MLTIHEYALYPDFKFQGCHLTPYKLRQEEKNLLEAARMAIKIKQLTSSFNILYLCLH